MRDENERIDEHLPLLKGQAKKTSDSSENTVISIISASSLNSDLDSSLEIEQQDALIALTRYYLVARRQTDIKYNVGKYVLLNCIAGTSVWLYGATGGLAAENNLALKILLITGGTTLNFCVSFNTSEMFVDYIKSNQVPRELKKFLKPKVSKLEMVAVAGAAFISAGPTTFAVFSSAEKISAMVITETVITQIDNSFIHTLPTLVISRVPLLRLLFLSPFLPLLLCYKFYKTVKDHVLLTEEDIALRKLREIKAQRHTQLKNAMMTTLEAAREAILKLTFQSRWHWRALWKTDYAINLPADLKTLSNLIEVEPLIKIASYAPKIENLPPASLSARILNFVTDTVLGNAIYGIGAIAGNLGAAGFYKNTYDDMVVAGNYTQGYFKDHAVNFTEKDASAWGWGLSLVPNAIAIILVGYFAGRFFRHSLYENFIAVCRGQYSPPQGFKRYPKVSALLIVLAVFFAKYGYGTAYYLVQTHFNEPQFDKLRPVLLQFAEYGMPIFLLKNTIEVIFNQTVNYASFFGHDDNQASAELDRKILALENAIQNADGGELEKSLNNLSKEQQGILLRLPEAQLNVLLTRK